MKKLILSIALGGMLAGGATGYAAEYHSDVRRVAHTEHRRDSLDRQINHMNRMLEHVRWEARQYRADWRVRREVERLSRETERINHRFRSGDFDRSRLRSEVAQLRDRLHAIETRLHVRSHDFYRWD